MKRSVAFLLILFFGFLCSCAISLKDNSETSKTIEPNAEFPQTSDNVWQLTDALGHELTLEAPQRVISLYGSFAEVWTLAGGTLTATTQDAVEERGMMIDKDVEIIGTVKNPDLERIIALEPDFVILSADITAHVQLNEILTQMQIPHAYFRVDTYQDYLEMLSGFCTLTGRDDLYVQNGTAVENDIKEILKKIPVTDPAPRVLLIRAYSSGAKAKGSDNLAGIILADLHTENIVEQHESLLEELSIEAIIAEDPDYIFVSVMGSDEEAREALQTAYLSNPAWAQLKAVQNNHFIFLPKDLFHYKPNARWAESYAYLAEILYPAEMN